MKKEFAVLRDFIKRNALRYTPQREEILKAFLSVEQHISAEELHKIVRKNKSSVGYVSVYRTMKLLEQAGLCSEIDFGDGKSRFEHKYGHQHHDHLVCVKCGTCIEVSEPELERLQEVLAKENGFVPLKHKLQIFGLCRMCGKE